MINVNNLWVIDIAGFEIWITETIFNTWIVMLILIVFAIIARIKLNSFQVVPSGIQNIIELIIETFDNFVLDSVGKKAFLYSTMVFYGLCFCSFVKFI